MLIGTSKATTALIILDFATLYILGALIAIAHSFGHRKQTEIFFISLFHIHAPDSAFYLIK